MDESVGMIHIRALLMRMRVVTHFGLVILWALMASILLGPRAKFLFWDRDSVFRFRCIMWELFIVGTLFVLAIIYPAGSASPFIYSQF